MWFWADGRVDMGWTQEHGEQWLSTEETWMGWYVHAFDSRESRDAFVEAGRAKELADARKGQGGMRVTDGANENALDHLGKWIHVELGHLKAISQYDPAKHRPRR